MKLSDYKKIKGNDVLRQELELMGFTFGEGWRKKVKRGDVVIDDSHMLSILNELCARGHLTTKKAQQVESFITNKQPSESKKVYLLQNDNGMLKIGISVDPHKRARSIATASGVPVDVLNIWEHELAESIERDVLKNFSLYRTIGEWFNGLDKELIVDFVSEEYPDAAPQTIFTRTDISQLVSNDGCVLLKDYISIRCRQQANGGQTASLTKPEKDCFGIFETERGWHRKYSMNKAKAVDLLGAVKQVLHEKSQSKMLQIKLMRLREGLERWVRLNTSGHK